MALSIRTLLLFLTAVAALYGCGSSSSRSNNDGMAGPCVHNYYEPVLNINQVIAIPSNTEIDKVFLTEVIHGDSEVELEAWCALQAEGLCYGLSFVSEETACSLPCGFGTSEGEWRVEVSAEGYQSTKSSLDASYATFEGGCPSYNDEGTHFELELNESGS